MENEFFYVIKVGAFESGLSSSDLYLLAAERFNCAGHEEYSLNEEEVDLILGDEAFCGGDLTFDLMDKLEEKATKEVKYYFTGIDGENNSGNFFNYLKEENYNQIEISKEEEKDWNESWKVHYSPIDLGKFVILPVWESDTEISEQQEKIIINPGMGFGTGTHETTRQCILCLLDEVEKGQIFNDCLDFGSGSGILGIAFQKICKAAVDFVDIDQRALDNNKDNVNLNFKHDTLSREYFLREEYKLEKKYDLVFANILEHVLLEEYPILRDASSNLLIVSGLLKEQKGTILDKFTSDFTLINEKSEGDWLALTFKKMISCLLDTIIDEKLVVEGDNYRHLVQSLRVKEGDQVLTLDGNGKSRITTIVQIEKKKVTLEGGEVIEHSRDSFVDLLLCPPKKEALNDCLRASCELGVGNIYFYQSEYTQNKKLDEDKLSRVLKSSLIQSNNPFMPKLINIGRDLSLLPRTDIQLAFHPVKEQSKGSTDILEGCKTLVCIGPEGGFSDCDLSGFKESFSNLSFVTFKTPILRTPTALCAALGWVNSKSNV